MQTASSSVPYTATHPPIQHGYQGQATLSDTEFYALKRQYLGLLSSSQIIDICLTFEAHAPVHIRSTIWPFDIKAAIASLQSQASTQRDRATPKPTGISSTEEVPLMASLADSAPSETPVSSSDDQAPADTASSSRTETPQRPTSAQAPVAPSQPSTTPGPPPPVASVTQPHYPHQPYGYPAYPHAPYYPPPQHTGYPYASHSHPYGSAYPQPASYPPNSSSHPPPLFTNAPLIHAPHPPEMPSSQAATDDLPSYEEMIVEALIDSGDADGCAPKNLFSWMAVHYPLQTNFRPSASQALQKAFKRGRLEKGSNGKYRLNAAWEGGNTSRRTTRRPQTHSQSSLPTPQPLPPPPPFTHAPLHPNPPSSSSIPGQPPYANYPYGYSAGYAAYPHYSPYGPAPGVEHPAHPAPPGPGVSMDGAGNEIGEGSDAWEAAQNILKAINFGQLLQISDEDQPLQDAPPEATTSETVSVDHPPPVFAATHGDISSVSGSTAIESVQSSIGSAITRISGELTGEGRAALQAQLALLAAQLAEIADVGEGELAQDLADVGKNPSVASTVDVAAAQLVHFNTVAEEEEEGEDEDDDDDMEMVEVPMNSGTLVV
ncbi:hypothetical protein SERLA73DRAFT_74573 [Serpula lacrymans var. lacrymans S7.3]|uniref:Histone H1 n=1 Tax=Serpula lacrymans var. lacrymans (strain S7.3) TaxID=936435 RepID=F8PZM7_SERL3|nr:hypothetical protein SERLA73DRAFT_74573 [Serpula lacrymans var. lacrymans S7.3]